MLKFKFIGWCCEDHHDKVWSAIELSAEKCVTVWGRRGKKLQTKIVDNNYDLHRLMRSKVKKGYVPVNEQKLNEVYPNFQKDLEKTAFWATFKI